MSTKSLVWIFMFLGSLIGESLPLLWGDSFLSLWSLFWSTVGGIAGVLIGLKIGNAINN